MEEAAFLNADLSDENQRGGDQRLSIVGGGSWGTALAVILASGFEKVRVWAHNPRLVTAVNKTKENVSYLPGVRIPENVGFTHDPAECLEEAGIVLIGVPSLFFREVVTSIAAYLPAGIPLISATKGLEAVSMLRMSQVLAEAARIDPERVLALSGPSFAAEVARMLPTAVVVAGANQPVSFVQSAFSRPSFRVYSSDDLVGVELGGALKNVIAIGAGMIAGMGMGHNAVAALITRGLAEITRLAVCLGAEARTLSGLAGLGDLVLTCTGELSRNRDLGVWLSSTNTATELLSKRRGTTEGVRAAGVAVALGRRYGIDMPVAEQMQQVLECQRSPQEAIRLLMERSLKGE